MSQQNICFIGAGNMARSLIGGMVNSGYDPAHIWASDPNAESLAALKQFGAIHTSTSNAESVTQAEVIVFAIKPQQLPTVAQQIQPLINTRQQLGISIAAGIRLPDIQRWLADKIPLIRCMPNTPAMIGSGATGLFAGPGVAPQQRAIAENMLASVGITLWVEQETLLDTVTALSGSGPAYFFLMMDALQNAAVELGLTPQQARALTIQTGLGAAQMAQHSPHDLSELRRQVTSPGGTTEAAIQILQSAHVEQCFARALHAAHTRSIELAATFGDA